MVKLKICYNLLKDMKKTGNVIKPKFPFVIKPHNIHGTMVKVHYCMLSENIQNTLHMLHRNYYFQSCSKILFFDAL